MLISEFYNASDFRLKKIQRVRLSIKIFTTRQICKKNIFLKSMSLKKRLFLKKHDCEEKYNFKKQILKKLCTQKIAF